MIGIALDLITGIALDEMPLMIANTVIAVISYFLSFRVMYLL
jgi:hypothetical protein